jgi:hypothetical protein
MTSHNLDLGFMAGSFDLRSSSPQINPALFGLGFHPAEQPERLPFSRLRPTQIASSSSSSRESIPSNGGSHCYGYIIIHASSLYLKLLEATVLFVDANHGPFIIVVFDVGLPT